MLTYSSIASQQYHEIGYSKDQTFTLFNSTIPRPASSEPPVKPVFTSPAKVLFIGRLIPSKGVERLVRAASMLNKKGIQLEVQIVGDGPDFQRLKGIANSLGAPVRFLGKKTGDELASISHNADLFVLPGLGGLAIQEAMSNALPVIVTEADGTEKDLVTTNGWVAKKEDSHALAQCIEAAVSDPEELRRRGRESYRIVYEKINLDFMADRFVNAAAAIHQRKK
jgi:glycosyltransferase involved in cell wall biosynthesis